MFFTIIIFLIVLGVLVFVHELGHFFAARRFGVKAEEFGLGFPPRLFGFYRSQSGKRKFFFGSKQPADAASTIYSVNWMPLGGFVNIKGENGEDEKEEDSFAHKKIWQRAIILSAGVAMNFILAALLITVGLSVGMPRTIGDEVSARAEIVGERRMQIVEVRENSPAALAGFKIGDFVYGINDASFSAFSELQQYVDARVGQELSYRIKRGDEDMIVKAEPEFVQDLGHGGIGIALAETAIVKYPFPWSVWEGVKTIAFLTWAIILAFYELFKNIILGNGLTMDVAGPVGIATMTGQAAKMGLIYVLQFTAVLSVNLAIINFLPFPALDGGRVLFLFIEKLKGSPVRKEIESTIHYIGFSLLMLLLVFVTARDFVRLGDKFKAVWEKMF